MHPNLPSTLSRRQLLARTGSAMASLAVTRFPRPAVACSPAPALPLPPLPYAEDALAPALSAEAVRTHYRLHQQWSGETLTTLLPGTALDGVPLETIIRSTASDPARVDIFQHAAQVWNHTFYWHSLCPDGGGIPTGKLAEQLAETFCGFGAFKQAMLTAATTVFGSGWVWLVLEQGGLKLRTTSDTDTPLVHDWVPLLGVDVWEHAYYLDYQHSRAMYVSMLLEHCINWDFAAENLTRA